MLARTAEIHEIQVSGGLTGTFGSGRVLSPIIPSASVRAGFEGVCDAGLDLSYPRQELSFRCAPLSELRGHEISLAPVAGIALVPTLGLGGRSVAWDARFGIDISRKFGESLTPLVNLSVTHGYKWFKVRDLEDDESGWMPVQDLRRETQLEANLGLSIGPLSKQVYLVLALAPYWVLGGAKDLQGAKPDGLSWTLGVGSFW